ncbi:uracil-DNA glycosylase [Thiorhodococcus mannitoliphagus]|uniref:Type-5 uracil-DNA glycosylase n=1 Tax=Thiorhodococcus mannitoliphagus TaxID=329406 RepID=A0A6P1DRA7_9GAMM|nr:uracil-DNA glycosylase [Thiorhodococcus mannitoliphagus]NEX20588.1 uracil-DNA glycosylase [Thiorhodococcus mannitoliphagus]
MTHLFDPNCRRCPRLAAHLAAVRQAHPDYHAAPVASFGDVSARLLVVGLAPGMHGANATGRPFTGDHAGILLYATLHRFGFATRPVSTARDDGLRLQDCRITNAVKCLPPENKPTTAEVRSCNPYLAAEIEPLADGAVIIALGRVAHTAVARALGLPQARLAFAHGAEHGLPGGRVLLDSYHCSRYNTQTRRLTEAQFHQVFARARALLGSAEPSRMQA